MKRFFQRIGYSIARFMYGRYGNDGLNTFLLVLAWILMLVGCFPFPLSWICSIVALLLILWTLFRTFSRRVDRRRREYDRFHRIVTKPKRAWRLHKNKKRDKKTHLYFKCVKCRAVLRVPLNKGSIIVTCPRCGERVEKNT